MANKAYIVIPGTNIRLYDSDTVSISNKPKDKFIVHNGWYVYQGVQQYGWYLVSINTTEVLPAYIIDLTLCTLETHKTIGSDTCDGPKVEYTKPFTEADAEILNRTFITVDTITQRDNLDPKTLINGRLVRVNDVDGLPVTYYWDAPDQTWVKMSDSTGGGIPEVTGTPSKPIIISNLEDGLYRVIGVYKISSGSPTIVTTIDHIAFTSGIDPKVIKLITETTVIDYQVTGGTISLVNQYAYEDYVDDKVDALERQISEIISELSASGIAYVPPQSGVTSGSDNVQDAIDALNDAISGGDKEVFYGTTSYWNEHPQFVPIKGCVYVYSDHTQDDQGNYIPGIKIGDGTSYLIDMPFIDEKSAEHIADTLIHVSANDRDAWDNKVRCFIDPTNLENLVFTTN